MKKASSEADLIAIAHHNGVVLGREVGMKFLMESIFAYIDAELEPEMTSLEVIQKISAKCREIVRSEHDGSR